MPRRVDLLRPVLESLLAQRPEGIVASIELNLPYLNVRTGENYSIPEWLSPNSNSNFTPFDGRVRIFRTPDYGTITKVAPTLLRHATSKDMYIWSVDDDTVYDRYSLFHLLEHEPVAIQFAKLHRIHDPASPVSDSIITSHESDKLQLLPPPLRDSTGDEERFLLIYSGFDILDDKGVFAVSFGTCSPLTFAQVFRGFRGALYPPRLMYKVEQEFEQYVQLTSSNPDCRISDDVVMSNFLEARGVARFVVESGTIRDLKLQHDMDRDATHSQTGGHGRRYARVIEWLRNESLLVLGARKTTTCS